MKTDETINLIKRAKQGDVDAFAEVFEALRSLVFGVAYRLVGANDADDVVMETYLKAWKAIPNFNERSSLKTWLYRITYNCANDFLRKRQRSENRFIHDQDEETHYPELPGHQPSPLESLTRQENKAVIDHALERIPHEHRISLLLRYADGLSYSEIAAATGVSIGTVMSRLFNGKRKLKKVLDSLEGTAKRSFNNSGT